MPNPFLDKNVFSPHLTREVAAAYGRNREKSQAIDTTSAGAVGVRSLGELVRGAVKEAKDNGTAGSSGLNQLSNPDTRQAFADSFKATEELFNLISLTIPTIDECVDSGVDMAALGTAYERMMQQGLEPAVVLAPNLDIQSWCQLYKDIADISSIARAGYSIKDGGLDIANTICDRWGEVAGPYESAPLIYACDSALSWSLRLIPSTQEAPARLEGYDKNLHPTIAEYLSLQAIRLQAADMPMDDCDDIWLNGNSLFRNGSNGEAPIASWDAWNNQLVISWDFIDAPASAHGARPPVWK